MKIPFNPKKLLHGINDHNLNLQERMFRLLLTIGLGGMTIGVVIGAISGEDVINVIILVGGLTILFGITFFSIRYHRIQLGAVLIAAIILYLVLPFNFVTTGGIYGGGPIWFLFGMVYVCLVVEGRIKYVFLGSGFAVFIVCYYIAYFYPTLIIQHTLEMAYMDSLMTLTIISVLTCGMILFQKAVFRSENEITQKQKKEIEDLNKMQNNFFSSMSHEIRTPINTIIGLNEMILREDVSDEVAEDARNIQSASKMLLTLINDILDMSKIESGKMDIVPVVYDTGDMLSDIVNMIWVRAKKKNLKFHVDIDHKLPSQLFGDEVRIKQILINILNNAVKYTSEGSVTLSIQCRKMEKGSAQIIYSVTDTGTGIKKENIPYLFNAFKRIDEEKNRYIEGTGLGLSIVKQLVDLMGGEIAVNSVYTKGSTFVITLPQEIVGEAEIGELNLETRHEMNLKKHYKQSFEAPKAHILIVDDNDTNLLVAQKLLRDTKVQIDTVTSGQECLKKTLQNRYDVIFMDHLMPEMDGIECLHALRTQTGGFNQTVPVVILTANAGGNNQALYKREGFDGYLLKPVTGKQLETELLRHLPRKLVRVNKENVVGEVETPVYEHREKMSLMISTDSVCDLPREFIDKYQIAVMPYRVLTEGGEFLDGVEAETDGLLSYMSDRGKLAKSEPPREEDYEIFFADQLTKAQYVVHISMARKVSQGYANALEASKNFDNVTVIDSGHLSCGMGLMVMRAAEYAAGGMTTDAVRKELEQMKNRVQTSFIVNSTEYLARSGRLPEKADMLCKNFLLHPVLVLKNSSMKIGSVIIGTRNYTWKKYISSALANAGRIDTKTLFLVYSGLTNQELREIEDQIKEKISFERIVHQKASSAISTNCGPGSFGLLFTLKEGR